MHLDDYDIVSSYGAEYRGIVQYYLLAVDVWRLTRQRWTAETSMLVDDQEIRLWHRFRDGGPAAELVILAVGVR